MISHKHKCVFIHIPKTSGVSIYNVLESREQHHKTLDGHKGWKHEYFKFCFVRNTWDRFLSTYFYFKKYGRRRPGDLKDGKIINQFKDFKGFVESFHNIEKKFSDRHFNCQVYWIDERLDFIGKFENLQEDFNIVCDKIGIPQQKLPHKNKSKHKHYTEYYDDETRQIVAEKYAKDIERFGYEFGE